MSSMDLEGLRQLTEYGLTMDEDIKCNKAFDAFDKDGSGYIDACELNAVLEMMGQEKPEAAIYRMISEASPSHENAITLD